MENVGDSGDGKAKEAKTKGVRRISLKVCVAKAAGWTLEKANPATSQEASINKTQWLNDVGVLKHENCISSYFEVLWNTCDSQNHHPD